MSRTLPWHVRAAEESSIVRPTAFTRSVLAVVGAVVLSACANGAGAGGANGVFFPTLPHMNGWPTALMQGRSWSATDASC
jgi:hypothetical protein